MTGTDYSSTDDLERIDPPLPAAKRISRRLVFTVAAALLALIAMFSVTNTKNKKVKRENQAMESTKRPYVTSAGFNGLPKSYGDLKEPKKPEPEPVFIPDAPKVNGPPRVRPVAVNSRPQKTPEEIENENARASPIFFTRVRFSSSMENEKTAQPVRKIDPYKAFEAVFRGNREDEGREDFGYRETSETRINQRSKQAFLKQGQEEADGAVYLDRKIQGPVSPYQIMAGTVLPAALITGINSDLPGQIIAQVKENIFDTVTGRYLLIPQGTKLIGRYDNMVSWGQERVLLAWSRLIFPNGSSILLDNMAGHDLSGYAGLKDKVNNHYLKIAGAILMSTFLSVGAKTAAGDIEGEHPTVGQEIVSQITADVNRSGQKIVNRQLNVAPTLEIRPGFPFNVMVNRDMVLRPYRG